MSGYLIYCVEKWGRAQVESVCVDPLLVSSPPIWRTSPLPTSP